MILLDTSIISELVKAAPAPQVLAWFDRQAAQPLVISAITVAELTFGVQSLPAGKRRNILKQEIFSMLAEDFAGAVLPFDRQAAEIYGVLAANLRAQGVAVGQSDTMIAAIALTHDAILVTRNEKHFLPCGVQMANPFTM